MSILLIKSEDKTLFEKIFAINDKYYFSMLGLEIRFCDDMFPEILEKFWKCIFLHFKAHGYTVSTWKLREKEIDFVVEKWGERKYIQVAYLIDGEKQGKENLKTFWKLGIIMKKSFSVWMIL